MKTCMYIIILSTLFSVGCKKENTKTECFKLKAVYLYQGSNTACPSNIWQIEYSPDSEIPSGTYVDFTTNGSYDPSIVNISDIVYLKLTMKVKIVPGTTPFCPFKAGYFLQGDLCK